MKLFIVITATSMLLSCGQPPTVPRKNQAPTTNSSTAAGESSVPAPPPAPVGPSGGSFSWRIVSADDRWEVELTNNERTRPVFVACYKDPDRDIATQELYDVTRGRVRSGETITLSAETPCGNWQCDAVEGENVLKTAPFFGSNLILGRIGRRSGGACNPPPVCNVSQLARDADAECEFDFELDVMACTFTCLPPLECDGQELIARAIIECGSLEVKSLDFEACTSECHEP